MRALVAAIFLLLSSPFTYGGEWHSAGNAPVMPHVPSFPVNFVCKLTGYTRVGVKEYRFESERPVSDKEFRASAGAAFSLTLENTGDPGMDGQSLTLSFGGGEGEEIMNLRVHAVAEGKASASAVFSAPVSAKVVRGVVSAYVEKPARRGLSSVRVVAECKNLN